MPLNEEEMKKAVQEGIETWLDKQLQTFGRWSLHSVMALVLAGLIYFMINIMGYHK